MMTGPREWLPGSGVGEGRGELSRKGPGSGLGEGSVSCLVLGWWCDGVHNCQTQQTQHLRLAPFLQTVPH